MQKINLFIVVFLIHTILGCNKSENVNMQNDMFTKHQVASMVHLKDLELFLEKADAGIVRWVTAQTKADNPEKKSILIYGILKNQN